MTDLQHIGGAWECVDSRTDCRRLPLDPLCYPWWCECEYETPMTANTASACEDNDAKLWSDWYVPDWNSYHAAKGEE